MDKFEASPPLRAFDSKRCPGSREFDVLNLCCGGEVDKGENLNLNVFLGPTPAFWPAHMHCNISTTPNTAATDYTLADFDLIIF